MNGLEIDIEIYMFMYYHIFMYYSIFNEDENDFILNLFQELPITYSTCLKTFRKFLLITSVMQRNIFLHTSVFANPILNLNV